MKSYSPINNVRYGQIYPACLLTGGLYDPRVQFWEPAKFAAELRHGVSKDSGKVLLKVDMDAGHLTGNDRYKHLRELSFGYAFLLDELGLV
jgi:oligopeptidase B